MRSRIIAAFAVVGVLFGGSALLPASAAPVNPNGSGAVRQATTIPNTQGAVTGWHVQDGSLYCSDLGSGMCEWFLSTPDGTIRYNSLDAALKAKVDAPGPKGDAGAVGPQGPAASDVKGSVVTKTFDPKVIQYIGGPYFDPARGFTTIGTFTLPAGTWVVNTSVKFTRTVAGVEGVRPQVGLRIGQGTASPNWGTDLGTVGGEDISKVANKDLWGQAVQSITLTEETTVGVYGHGFTDTTGIEGSDEISAAVQVFATRG